MNFILLLNIILIFIIIFMVNCTNYSFSSKNKIIYTFVGIQLIVLQVFKDPLSVPDLSYYIDGYNYLSQTDITQIQTVNSVIKVEPGWALLNKLLTYISNDYHILFIFYALLLVFSYLSIINKYSKIPWISIVLFILTLFDQSLFVLRQHAAIALCFYSIKYINEKKFLKFFLTVLIATSLHYTAIIFLPIYFLKNIDLSKRFYFRLIILLIVSYLLFNKVIGYILENVSAYTSYSDRDGTNFTSLIMLIMVFVFVSFFNPKRIYSNGQKIFYIIFVLSLLLNFGGIGLSITSRLNMYYTTSQIILIPNVIYNMKLNNNKVLMTIIIVLCFIMYYFVSSERQFTELYKLTF